MKALRIIFAILAVVLLGLGAIGAFFGLLFRMEPGEEAVALLHDITVGIMLGAACFLAIHALPGRVFRTYRTRLWTATLPCIVAVAVVPTLLFSWQKSILERRKHNAEAAIRHMQQDHPEPDDSGGPGRWE